MGAFAYTALDGAGRAHKGVLEGDTARHVRALLREKSLLPVTVTEVAAQESRAQRSAGSFTLPAARVHRRPVAAHAPARHAGARRRCRSRRRCWRSRSRPSATACSSILLGVRAKVMEGHTLATGLADFPRVFPEIYRATVAAGEQSGHLDTVLERLADYGEGREALRQKVMGAMLYPLVLTIMSFAIVSILLAYVVPKVVEVFESSHAKLPLMTRALVALSDVIRHYGIWILLAIVIGAVLFVRWQRDPAQPPAACTAGC